MADRLIYNITFKVDKDASDNWLNKLKKEYLPGCRNEVGALGYQVNRIMIESPDGDMSYALQLNFNSENEFRNTVQPFISMLVQEIDKDFRSKYVYFGTIMKVIHSEDKGSSVE